MTIWTTFYNERMDTFMKSGHEMIGILTYFEGHGFMIISDIEIFHL